MGIGWMKTGLATVITFTLIVITFLMVETIVDYQTSMLGMILYWCVLNSLKEE